MVRSAFGDREHQSIFLTTGSPTTGCTRGYESWIRHGGLVYHVKFYPKTTTMAFGKNYEQPMFTKILSSKDPQRRIESCIAPGLPANGR